MFVMKINNIKNENVEYLNKIIESNNCRIDKITYINKDNGILMEDGYIPIYLQYFNLNYTVICNEIYFLEFIKYLYINRLKTIENLKDNLALV